MLKKENRQYIFISLKVTVRKNDSLFFYIFRKAAKKSSFLVGEDVRAKKIFFCLKQKIKKIFLYRVSQKYCEKV